MRLFPEKYSWPRILWLLFHSAALTMVSAGMADGLYAKMFLGVNRGAFARNLTALCALPIACLTGAALLALSLALAAMRIKGRIQGRADYPFLKVIFIELLLLLLVSGILDGGRTSNTVLFYSFIYNLLMLASAPKE